MSLDMLLPAADEKNNHKSLGKVKDWVGVGLSTRTVEGWSSPILSTDVA